MRDSIFLDTNIWLYLYSKDDASKRSVVQALVEKNNTIIVSTQVLNELANVLMRKKNLTSVAIQSVFKEVMAVAMLYVIDMDTIIKALQIAQESKYSYYDSLIVSSALQNDCSILYTEDLHHQHVVDKRLKIINPFKI